MKSDKPSAQFWMTLTAVNVLALIYPADLLRRAASCDENLFAALAVIGIVFVLIVVDVISIVIVDLLDPRL